MTMRRLLPLIACLMLVLTGLTSVAHAAEPVGGSVEGLELAFHAPGDADEVPADSDNGLPHHHTICHGHDLGTPSPTIAEPLCPLAAALRGGSAARALVALDASVNPRPPQT